VQAYALAIIAGLVLGGAYRMLGGLAALAFIAAFVIAALYAEAWPGARAQISRIGRARFIQALLGCALGALSFFLVVTVQQQSTPAEIFGAMAGIMVGLGWALHCARRRVG